eukprot:284818978_6
MNHLLWYLMSETAPLNVRSIPHRQFCRTEKKLCTDDTLKDIGLVFEYSLVKDLRHNSQRRLLQTSAGTAHVCKYVAQFLMRIILLVESTARKEAMTNMIKYELSEQNLSLDACQSSRTWFRQLRVCSNTCQRLRWFRWWVDIELANRVCMCSQLTTTPLIYDTSRLICEIFLRSWIRLPSPMQPRLATKPFPKLFSATPGHRLLLGMNLQHSIPNSAGGPSDCWFRVVR